MANQLTELTDRVLREVIKNEVILPSTYKEHFDNHAREMQIDLDYENITSEETQRQLTEANELTEKTYCNLDTLQKTTQDAQDAIRDKDLDKLAIVTQEISGLKNALGELKAQLHTDTLTNVHNRKWLMENILYDGDFISNGILAFIDLDKFKPINDKYGHVIGDKVLQYLAGFLKSNLKGMDIVRYAGDEFIIVSKNEHMEQCYLRLKQLQEDLLSKKLKAANGELLYLSFSFGMARFETGTNFRDTLEIADSLMYENKKSKKAS
jgi:diguanylate cyclase (GGDEF)-like protein